MHDSSTPPSPTTAQVLHIDERRHARLGRWLVLVGFGGFLLWAALAPLDRGVGVSGSVVVAGNRQAVQPVSGGLVRRLMVREGDQVQAGQVLLQLDETDARALRDALRVQYIGARASEARWLAERDGLERISFAPDLLQAQSDPWVDTALELQRQLLRSRRQSLESELAGLGETIAGTEATLQGLRASMQHKEEQRASMREQLDGLRELVREGYVARNRLLENERLYAQVNGEISRDLGDIGRTRRQILELRLRVEQRREEYRKEVREQLSDSRLSAQELAARLKGAEFELSNALLRAPATGTVVGLNVFTEGGVVSPGQTLMEIVPLDAPLLVDARAPVELVDKLHPGLDVELMFSAFSQSRTPRVNGKLTLVSADRLLDPKTGEPYYNLRVQVDDQGLRQLQGQVIRPGMPVEAFVRTGERSLLNYLFKPLADRTHMALVEE
ncbi:HlyD family type I secretion periplasmic adaptor subunit [Pseudomonas kuykendallii]|uniref:Membrane fusion protein (MFP) family protein n=1 Tax=Pseudomonas kuykendallii TaxID=1007099 RepID=A0A1H2SBU9_9PSED|nr:HlyD family type I secretion periplasmic adaptor subunit [Pseudomonas kuykendallii]MCQ4270482.1 HlyD family type I secretion periplasmic adaptor subunit [Pseudomonas kuykendallii]SDW28988.1 membrane fusion protein, protease secretion system [Pseudomonas kuykendallii]